MLGGGARADGRAAASGHRGVRPRDRQRRLRTEALRWPVLVPAATEAVRTARPGGAAGERQRPGGGASADSATGECMLRATLF